MSDSVTLLIGVLLAFAIPVVVGVVLIVQLVRSRRPPVWPKAGWYPNPDRPPGLRYWDGTHWTDSVAPPPAHPRER